VVIYAGMATNAGTISDPEDDKADKVLTT